MEKDSEGGFMYSYEKSSHVLKSYCDTACGLRFRAPGITGTGQTDISTIGVSQP